VAFDLRRIMRSRYRIDAYQETYFVVDSFQQLFDATRPDFAPLYRELATLEDLAADAASPATAWSRPALTGAGEEPRAAPTRG